MNRKVYQIEYRQRFTDSREWLNFKDTFVGHGEVKRAIEAISQKLLGQNMNGYDCNGLEFTGITILCEITL